MAIGATYRAIRAKPFVIKQQASQGYFFRGFADYRLELLMKAGPGFCSLMRYLKKTALSLMLKKIA